MVDDNSSNGWLFGHNRVRLCKPVTNKQTPDLQATQFNGRQNINKHLTYCADAAAAHIPTSSFCSNV